MGIFKVSPQKRGPRGEGRAKIYKALQLPVDVIDELKLYQNAYSLSLSKEVDKDGYPITEHVSFEQMLNHWMDNVKKFDKPVYDFVQSAKQYREEHPAPPTYPVDPTDCKVWEMTYSVERDGEEYDMEPDEKLYFSTIIDGEKVGVEQLINEEWCFMNEAGIEINLEQAKVISKRILKHNKKEKA